MRKAVENCVWHLAHFGRTGRSRLETICDAAIEVHRTNHMFGELIIAIVYLPILALKAWKENCSGR